MKTSNKIKVITTTVARKNISEVINEVAYMDNIYAIGRRNKIEALIMKFPENLNKDVNEITNVNANSKSFEFLEKEPDLYSINDLKNKYV